MTQDPQVAQGVSESADDALIACLTEIERFVASSSWGGPPRLFALVRTVDLVKAEPALAGQLAIGSHDSKTLIIIAQLRTWSRITIMPITLSIVV